MLLEPDLAADLGSIEPQHKASRINCSKFFKETYVLRHIALPWLALDRYPGKEYGRDQVGTRGGGADNHCLPADGEGVYLLSVSMCVLANLLVHVTPAYLDPRNR